MDKIPEKQYSDVICFVDISGNHIAIIDGADIIVSKEIAMKLRKQIMPGKFSSGKLYVELLKTYGFKFLFKSMCFR